MLFVVASFIGLLLCSVCGLPAQESERYQFASEVSQLLATELLKFNIDIDANQVHSPIGVATILAVLSEGAAGDTLAEFQQVFNYPKERSALRDSYKRILATYQQKENTEADAPMFQTSFYVYRNYSAKADFKRLINETYFVDIRDISREQYDWSEPSTSLDLADSTSTEGSSNSKDVIGFETLKRIKLDDNENEEVTQAVADSYGEEVVGKEASKFDRFVDDKQYVEKPVALAETVVQPDQEKLEQVKENVAEVTGEKLEKPAEPIPHVEENLATKTQTKRDDEALNLEENETVQEDEKLRKNYNEAGQGSNVPVQEVLISNEPEKVSLPLNAKETASKNTDEIMLALESHLASVSRVYGGRSLFRKDDIASALSANSITGRQIDSKTKMLLFNGLYFRGNWAQSFYEQPDESEFFFMTKDDAMAASMMHAKGQFRVIELSHLNARVLCLPYQNKKYSLAILLPNEPEGLNMLIEKLKPSDFKYSRTHGKLRDLHVMLPKFQIEETTRSEAMLKQLGLKKLFSRSEADLSLLSDDADLHVDEIVQFVSVRVDDSGSSTNALSAANSQARSPTDPELEDFKVNRPFLYFVMDCENQFVLASGKIFAPEYKSEHPISIEVELEQA